MESEARRSCKTCIVAGLLFLLAAFRAQAATYYVATTGDDANDGTTPEKAWRTVKYAAWAAVEGDTVFIKAGLYVDDHPTAVHSGTESAPIVFQGYTNEPGDTPDPHYVPGDVTLDSTVLPVLDGVDGFGDGLGVGWYRSHIVYRNLGLVRYNYGIRSGFSQYVTIENVYALNSFNANGEGAGFWFSDCDHITVRNCVVADAGMDNIMLERTHNSIVESSQTYAKATEPAAAATDYHIVIIDGHDNVVRNCAAYNLHSSVTDAQGGFFHPGHGIGIKDKVSGATYPNPHSTNNLIINCSAYGMGEYFFVAHEAFGNEFVNCTAVGDFGSQASWSEGINIRDGAHDNVFRNCRVQGARTSVTLQETEEGPPGAVQVTSNNKLINCTFTDSNTAIDLWNADDNGFVNCIFDGIIPAGQLIAVHNSRDNQRNTARNSIVTNIKGRYRAAPADVATDVAFTYSDFWANDQFTMPEGTGNLALDPLFVNAPDGDYHLKSQQGRFDQATSSWVKDSVTSPCIDAGDPMDDFSAEFCPNGGRIDIGAHGGTAEASLGAVTPGTCDCGDGEERGCYGGPAGSAGVGVCASGLQRCVAGSWGTCDGEVRPTAELCGDGRDNDCDGASDEKDACPGASCDEADCDGDNADAGHGKTAGASAQSACGCQAQGRRQGLALLFGLLTGVLVRRRAGGASA